MDIYDYSYLILNGEIQAVYKRGRRVNVGDIIKGMEGEPVLVLEWTRGGRAGSVPVFRSLESWELTEGYEFEQEVLGQASRWRIVPDDGGEYGCRALRVD